MKLAVGVAIAVLLGASAVVSAAQVQAPAGTPPSATSAPPSATFAESAALVAVSPTGDRELSLRVARFPGRDRATLWLALFIGEKRYGAVLEDVSLGAFTGRTRVEDREVSFAVEGPAADRRGKIGAQLRCEDRDTAAMRCTAHAEALAFESNDPPVGSGTIPVS